MSGHKSKRNPPRTSRCHEKINGKPHEPLEISCRRAYPTRSCQRWEAQSIIRQRPRLARRAWHRQPSPAIILGHNVCLCGYRQRTDSFPFNLLTSSSQICETHLNWGGGGHFGDRCQCFNLCVQHLPSVPVMFFIAFHLIYLSFCLLLNEASLLRLKTLGERPAQIIKAASCISLGGLLNPGRGDSASDGGKGIWGNAKQKPPEPINL